MGCVKLGASPMNDTGRVRLASWKEIAAYLRREVRTVIRWEKERGLPVHRLPGGQGGSVFAFADELDKWAAGELAREQPPPAAAKPARFNRRRLAIAAGVVLVAGAAAGAGLAVGWSRAELADVAVLDSAIEGRGADGRAIWIRAVAGKALRLPRRQTQVIDLTGDGRPDAAVTVPLQLDSDASQRGVLYALSGTGEPLWEREIDARLTFGAGDYDAPWQPDDLLAFRNGGEPFLAWAVHHHTWWPSLLAVYDARGTRIGAYVQSGWIRMTRATADGRHLITGGFSNSRAGAAFAVLDARRPDGASPEMPGSSFECRNCPPGRPLRYVVIEWSDVASALPPDERDVAISNFTSAGGIELRAIQRRNVEAIVELSPSFEIVRSAVSDAFWDAHERLRQTGAIDHGRDACRFRDGPVVHDWSPQHGWRTIGAR